MLKSRKKETVFATETLTVCENICILIGKHLKFKDNGQMAPLIAYKY